MKMNFKNTKRTIAAILSMVTVFSAAIVPNAGIITHMMPLESLTVSAANDIKVSGNWEYKVINNIARIAGYNGTSKNVVIPRTLGGYPVQYIYADVFNGNTSIESVTIPEGVISVASRCFRDASNLKTVSLPSTLQTIGTNAFTGTAIETITIPKGVIKIESGVFWKCSKLKTVTLPSTLEEIGSSAFFQCGSLATITLPSSLKKIGNNAFDSTALSSIQFPTSLNSIGSGTFRNTMLQIVNVPSNVESIGNYAFSNNKKLHSVTINGTPNFGYSIFENCNSVYNINLSLDALDSALASGTLGNCSNLQCINYKNIILFNLKTREPYINPEFYDVVLKNVSTLDLSGKLGGGPIIEHSKTPFFYNYLQLKIEYIVNSTTTDNMTDVQKAKALHDWICSEVFYDKNNKDAAKNHEDSSIFFSKSTVCDGYARGYALLLQEAGITTYYVYNSDHAWNIVQLGDHYFHIDLCHDDDSSRTTYDYSHFMLSDSKINMKTCYHNEWKLGRPSDLYNYENNVPLPTCNYSIGDVDKDGAVTEADATMIQKHCVQLLRIPEGDKVLADVNLDGNIDVSDAVCILSGGLN